MRTQTKVALISALVCISIVVLFGTAVYYFLNEYSYVDFYKRLETRVRIAANYNLKTESTNVESIKNMKTQYLEKLEKEQEYFVALPSKNNPAQIALAYQLPEPFIKKLINSGRATGKNGNVFFAGSKYPKDGKHYLVIVSAENYYASHHLMFLRNILLVSIVLAVFIVIFISLYFSKQIFDPIKKITDRVKLISTESIHLRLTTHEGSNEINDLVTTFNDLLNRIETAFETQKNFISNASHELGTPLTAIIGEADVSLLKARTPEEYQRALQNILQQAGRLDQITKSLLFLAQTGYKGKTIVFERIRIDEIIWETKALIDQLNPGNNIVVDLGLLPEDPDKLKIKGNRQLLQMAIANILNNACKYSNNKPVVVYIASSNSSIIITIKDQGIGIPQAELAYIYDPFFRASNTGTFEGYGIGLPLSRNVINLHKGELTVSAEINAGTTVQIKLPLMQA